MRQLEVRLVPGAHRLFIFIFHMHDYSGISNRYLLFEHEYNLSFLFFKVIFLIKIIHKFNKYMLGVSYVPKLF